MRLRVTVFHSQTAGPPFLDHVVISYYSSCFCCCSSCWSDLSKKA